MTVLKMLVKQFPDLPGISVIRRAYCFKVLTALRAELQRVPLIETGLDGTEKTPYAILKDSTILFGRHPTESQKRIYREWFRYLPQTLSLETIGVAIDIITRYLYPHAMPTLTMPYSQKARRRAFHPQHAETIVDLPILDKDKLLLRDIFSPKKDETFLDVGAYMGYGTVRMAKIVAGGEGNVIAAEADPENLRLLNRNVQANKLDNVIIIPKAIWKENTATLTFYKSERQANSLLDGIIRPQTSIPVESTTIDEVINDLGISTVNAVSLTLNGAEIEAIEGMKLTLSKSRQIRVSAAGWYERHGIKISTIITPLLTEAGLHVRTGKGGLVLAWK